MGVRAVGEGILKSFKPNPTEWSVIFAGRSVGTVALLLPGCVAGHTLAAFFKLLEVLLTTWPGG